MTKLYYMEDDASIAGAVKEYLEGQGLQVALYETVEDMKRALEDGQPALALIDWNMPDGQGDELCRWIRRRWPRLPVMFLTVRGEGRDIVSGFRSGADDYVAKPFELEVLYSRVRALLRRCGREAETVLACGGLRLDTGRQSVWLEQEELALNRMEYEILLLLLSHKGTTVTRGQLLEQIWDSNGNYVNDNTLTVAMKRLRDKLHHPPCLKTVRSFGYRMEDAE